MIIRRAQDIRSSEITPDMNRCSVVLVSAVPTTPSNFGNEQPSFLIIARRFMVGAYIIHSQAAPNETFE